MKTKIWVRLLLLLLLGTMLLGVVACTDEKTDPKNPNNPNTPQEEDPDEEPENVEYLFDIEDCGVDGHAGRFHMAVRSERADYVDTPDLDGTVINDAVYERNALIEELFNVEISMFEAGHSDATEYNTNITNDVLGGVGAYDCTQGWPGSGLDTSGYFMNLLSFPELDFANDPWWLDPYQQNATFYDCMFTCNGDLQFELYYNLSVLYFNKNLAQSLSVKDENNLPISSLVYQHVDNKSWTMDQMQKYGQIAATDAGEDGYHAKYEANYQNSEDIFGTVFNQSTATMAMFALGAKYSKVTNGAIEFTFTDPHNYDAFDKLFDFVNETEYNYMAQTTIRGKQGYEIFNDGHALFCWNSFYNAPYIKASGIPYGILPLPMYEANGEYATACDNISYFAFLTTTPDFHRASLVFNAMNALSTDILYDKYFGEYLEFRVSDDPDSSRMIPIIYDSIYFDCAHTNPGMSTNAFGYFGSYINDGNKSISAKMASYSNMKTYIDEMRKVYMNVKIGNSR